MRKLLNDPFAAVDEMLDGILVAYGDVIEATPSVGLLEVPISWEREYSVLVKETDRVSIKNCNRNVSFSFGEYATSAPFKKPISRLLCTVGEILYTCCPVIFDPISKPSVHFS